MESMIENNKFSNKENLNDPSNIIYMSRIYLGY
jgi:hypothetical protein